jgi:hypothetical protein
MSGKKVLILNRGSLKPILQEVPGSTPGQARLYIFGDIFGFHRGMDRGGRGVRE